MYRGEAGSKGECVGAEGRGDFIFTSFHGSMTLRGRAVSSAKGVVSLLTGGDQLDPLCVAARWGGVRDTGGGMFKRQQRECGYTMLYL